MKPNWRAIDDALDVMFAADPALRSFDRSDISAALGGAHRNYVSELLQQHRKAQRRGVTRYVIAGRNYGRSARWYVLAAPAKMGEKGRRRLTMGHTEHIGIDAARRVMSDLTAELDPALISHPVISAYLTHAGANLETQIRATVAAVQSAVQLVESLTGDTADRENVKTL